MSFSSAIVQRIKWPEKMNKSPTSHGLYERLIYCIELFRQTFSAPNMSELTLSVDQLMVTWWICRLTYYDREVPSSTNENGKTRVTRRRGGNTIKLISTMQYVTKIWRPHSTSRNRTLPAFHNIVWTQINYRRIPIQRYACCYTLRRRYTILLQCQIEIDYIEGWWRCYTIEKLSEMTIHNLIGSQNH